MKTIKRTKSRVDDEGRVCTKCGDYKLWDEFHTRPAGVNGKNSRCMTCLRGLALADFYKNHGRCLAKQKEYREEHREALNKKSTVWKQEHPEAHRKHARDDYHKNREARIAARIEWGKANPEKVRACDIAKVKKNPEKYREYGRRAVKTWCKKNPDRVAEKEGRRRAAKRQALPAWVDRDELRGIYRKAKELQRASGVRLNVDHIIPLQHPLVSGLHVPTNLRITTALENMEKYNKFDPWTFDPKDYPCLTKETVIDSFA